jgi:hypothetical protein
VVEAVIMAARYGAPGLWWAGARRRGSPTRTVSRSRPSAHPTAAERQICRVPRLPTRCLFLLDDLVAETDAAIADIDARSSDQLLDLVPRPPAERAPHRVVHPLRRSMVLDHATSIGLPLSVDARPDCPDGGARPTTRRRCRRRSGTPARFAAGRRASRARTRPEHLRPSAERRVTSRPGSGRSATPGSASTTRLSPRGMPRFGRGAGPVGPRGSMPNLAWAVAATAWFSA